MDFWPWLAPEGVGIFFHHGLFVDEERRIRSDRVAASPAVHGHHPNHRPIAYVMAA